MFGKINTKTDYLAAIEAAISEAEAHVSARRIAGLLRSRAQLIENRAARYVPPRAFDQSGNPIDTAAQVQAARAARQARIDRAARYQSPKDNAQRAGTGCHDRRHSCLVASCSCRGPDAAIRAMERARRRRPERQQ